MTRRRQVLVAITATCVTAAATSGAASLCCNSRRRYVQDGKPAPEYVVCLECETPCYTFEWESDKLVEAMCQSCGNDDVEQFARPEDIEELS